MKFLRELFDNDTLLSIFFGLCLFCLAMATWTLIVINQKVQDEKKAQLLEMINVEEVHEERDEKECLMAQLICYRGTIGMDEDEIIDNCKEIDFCLSR